MRLTLLITGLLTLFAVAINAQTIDPSGIWVTEGARSHISIYPCGGSFCGSVVRLAEPHDSNGRPKRDINNPDPAKRNRPLIGLRILRDLAPVAGENVWKGRIYNPEDGELYAGSIKIKGSRLEVEGCVLVIICQSQLWNRMKN